MFSLNDSMRYMYYTQPTDMLKPEYVEIGTEKTRTLERVTARVFISSTVRHKVILKSDIENKLPLEKNTSRRSGDYSAGCAAPLTAATW